MPLFRGNAHESVSEAMDTNEARKLVNRNVRQLGSEGTVPGVSNPRMV